jgi:hypothetical protein
MNQNKQNSVPQADSVQSKPASHFLEAAGRIFRVVCKLIVEHGFDATVATATFRRSYLGGTEDSLREKGWLPTDARLAITAGIPKSEVERFKAAYLPVADLAESHLRLTALSSVLSTWWTTARFTADFTSQPLELPFDANSKSYQKGFPTFSELVEKTVPGLDPNVALSELGRFNAIAFNEDTELLVAKDRALVPTSFDPSYSASYGRRVANLLNTLAVNFKKAGPGQGNFEKDARADYALSPEDEAKVDAFVRTEGLAFLHKVDAFMRSLPPAAEDNGRRVGVGMFFYMDKDSVEPSTQDTNSNNPHIENAQVQLGPLPDDAEPNVIDTLATPERDNDYVEIDTLADMKPTPRGKR